MFSGVEHEGEFRVSSSSGTITLKTRAMELQSFYRLQYCENPKKQCNELLNIIGNFGARKSNLFTFTEKQCFYYNTDTASFRAKILQKTRSAFFKNLCETRKFVCTLE